MEAHLMCALLYYSYISIACSTYEMKVNYSENLFSRSLSHFLMIFGFPFTFCIYLLLSNEMEFSLSSHKKCLEKWKIGHSISMPLQSDHILSTDKHNVFCAFILFSICSFTNNKTTNGPLWKLLNIFFGFVCILFWQKRWCDSTRLFSYHSVFYYY